MATCITTSCINCGSCLPACPNQAITEGDLIFEIDPMRCTECVGFHDAEACQTVCPVLCCLPDPERRETEGDLLARALRIHPHDTELHAAASRDDYPSRFRVG
jgi:ferredoxin